MADSASEIAASKITIAIQEYVKAIIDEREAANPPAPAPVPPPPAPVPPAPPAPVPPPPPAPAPVPTTAKVYVIGSATLPAGATRVSAFAAVPWATLPPGSRVIVSPGSYAGVTTIIGAKGTSAAPIVIEAADVNQRPVLADSVDIQNSAYLTVSGLLVQGAQYGGFILRQGTHHVTVNNNIVRQAAMGIEVSQAAGVGNVISNNVIEDSATNGIGVSSHGTAAEMNQIIGNTIRRSGHHGMEIESNFWRIERNVVSFSGQAIPGTSGIHLFGGYTEGEKDAGDNNIVRYNISYSNADRGASDGNGIQVDMYCDNNVVAFNQTWGNDGHGLIIYGARNNKMFGNTARGNSLDPMKTHGSLGEIVVANSAVNDRTSNNQVFDNIAVATRAEVPAIYVDSKTFQTPNTVGPNMMFNSAGGTVMRWSDSLNYKTATEINAATKTTGNLVEEPVFMDATAPMTGGWKLAKVATSNGTPLTGERDFAGVAATSTMGFFGAYFSAGATSVAPPPPAPPPAPAPGTGTALDNDIINASGAIVASAWDAMIAAVGTDKWADYRLGKAATNTSGGVKLFERPHKQYPSDASNAGQRGSIYEYGSYTYERDMPSGGGYSTVQMDVACFNDASGRSGIYSLQAAGYTNNTGQLKPQVAWQMGDQDHSNLAVYRRAGALPAGNVKPLFVVTANDTANDNGPSRLVVCADGSILGVGSNTADNQVSMKLPAGKVPVAGVITAKNEFLYVVVWDKATRKTQIAIIILAGLANLGAERWDKRTDPKVWTSSDLATGQVIEDWWQEWRQTYPGLPNRGNTAFMKLLGFVDTGLSAGTCCHATTGMHPWEMLLGNGRAIGYAMSPVKDHYTELRDGGSNGGKIARGGLLAVGSKSEKKVALIDLKGLHDWIYDSYYGANHARGEAQNLGMGDDQWPQVLSKSGVSVPVVKTLTFSAPVGDLRFTGTQPSGPSGNGMPQLWVCTTDGVAHIHAVGDYVPGVKTGKQGQPSQIAEKGAVSGLGPVSSMASMLGMKVTGGVDLNTGFWFVSRSTREIGYVKVNRDGTGGTVPLKYTPHADQCEDPVSAADVDNYSNESNSQIICDYKGKRVCSFRTDTLRHNGTWNAWPKDTPVQATNNVKVEFNGSYPVGGNPVHAITANVP